MSELSSSHLRIELRSQQKPYDFSQGEPQKLGGCKLSISKDDPLRARFEEWSQSVKRLGSMVLIASLTLSSWVGPDILAESTDAPSEAGAD